MKFISVISPCYNEEGNVEVLTDRVRELFCGHAAVPIRTHPHR